MTRAASTADAPRVTLTELLVSLAIAGLLFAAVFGILEEGQRAWRVAAARAETQQAARAALTRLVGDLRAAGFGGAGFEAVAVAEAQRIVLQQDLDGDGAIAATGERVTWRLGGGVLRRDAGGGAQPIVNGVRAIQLSYFDGSGAPTAAPGDVRSVGITLTVEPEHAVHGVPATTVSTRVRLRNR